MANPMLNSGPMLARGLAQSRASEPTYAALRTALAAGTYKIGQSVFVEAANPEGYGFGTGWFQVRNAASLTDDSLSTFVGGSYAALRHTGDAWAAYTNAISMLDAPGKHPAFSHTRATVGALCQQFDGSFYQPEIGEIGSHGMRRVRNLLASTDTLATQGVTVEAADYWLSFTGTGSVAVSGVATDSLAGTGVSDRVSKKITAGAAGTMTLTVTGSVTNAMLTKSRAGQLIADPEYVSRGVLSAPYHGWGIDGVRCFATDEDGNDLTSAASGYPVRAAGAVRNPAVTNLQRRSNAISLWASGIVNTTVTDNDQQILGRWFSRLSPTNTATEARYVNDSAISMTSGTSYTISAKVKSDGADYVQLAWGSTPHPSLPYANFDIATGALGTVVGGTATIENLSGGVYLITFTAAATATGTGGPVLVLVGTGSGGRIPSQAMDTADDVLVADVQVTASTDALPFVPTTTASVAVSADVHYFDPTALGYDQDGGGVFVLAHTPFEMNLSASPQLLTLYQDGNNQALLHSIPAGNFGAFVSDSGVAQWNATSLPAAWAPGEKQFVAWRLQVDDGALATDGVLRLTDTAMDLPQPVDMWIGGASWNAYSGAIEAVYYFPPSTVTDAQLLAMSNGDLPIIPELA